MGAVCVTPTSEIIGLLLYSVHHCLHVLYLRRAHWLKRADCLLNSRMKLSNILLVNFIAHNVQQRRHHGRFVWSMRVIKPVISQSVRRCLASTVSCVACLPSVRTWPDTVLEASVLANIISFFDQQL
jgi:hypothetical protein